MKLSYNVFSLNPPEFINWIASNGCHVFKTMLTSQKNKITIHKDVSKDAYSCAAEADNYLKIVS